MTTRKQVEQQLPQVFTPACPVSSPYLLTGRSRVLEAIAAATARTGASIVLYGERGVGKTSVAQHAMRAHRRNAVYYSASRGDTLEVVITAILGHHDHGEPVPRDPNEIARRLAACARLFVIDDFERIDDLRARTSFSDLIKKISDHGLTTTPMIVGIATSVEELVDAHASVERHVVPIEVPPLGPDEIRGFLRRGAKALGLEFDEAAMERIVVLARGSTAGAHLLAESAVRALLEETRDPALPDRVVLEAHVAAAVEAGRAWRRWRDAIVD